MSRHAVCPETMTINNLSDWMQSNKVDTINHMDKIPLTEEEINDLQKQSSLASRQIDKLKDTLKYFTETIKSGTPYDTNIEQHRPVSVTIVPTKGITVLEANRKFADRQLDLGYREDITTLYLIPWPEFKKMVALTIEGEEWTRYSRNMSDDEVRQHGRPILEASVEVRDTLEENGLRISEVRGKQVKIEKIKNQPPLSKAEMDLLNDDDEQPI